MKRPRMALIAVVFSAFAENARGVDLPDRFALEVGRVSVFNSDTVLESKRGMAAGTKIYFSRDLGGDDDPSAGRVAGYFRFNPHHRIDFGWYKIARNGKRIINRELRFRDAVFPVSAQLNSSIDLKVAKLGYTWSLYHVDKAELGLSVGTHWIGYEFAMSTAERTIVATASIDQLLPVWGLHMSYAINHRWHFLFDIESLSVELSDKLRGAMGEVQAGVEYRPLRHVYLAASLSQLTVDARVDARRFNGRVTDHYRSGRISIGLRY